MKKYHFLLVLFILSILFFCSCSANNGKTVFLSDKHGLSYEVIQNYALPHEALTLVLFDYHNDVLDDSKTITSFNWAGQLVEANIVKKIYWVSSYSLHELEKNSRKKWLNKNVQNKQPHTAQLILDSVEICGFTELKKLKLPKSTVISVDFDVFANETDSLSSSDSSFAKETALWINSKNFPLVTLAFSAAYEPEPEAAWKNLISFIENSSGKSDWYFKSGNFNEWPESTEDQNAWQNWKESPEKFEKYRQSFYKGAHLWINAPLELKKLLLEKNIQPYSTQDSVTAKVIDAWKDNSFQTLEQKYSYEELSGFAKTAVNALVQSLNGKIFPPAESTPDLSVKNSVGVAVRFRNTEHDRGCLALYCGVKDITRAIEYCAYEAAFDPRYQYISKAELDELYVNITIFSDWTQMSSPYDFVPGADSLIVDNDNAASVETERTLLQTPVAAEHTLDENGFLERLLKKAKLDTSYIDDPSLTFYKSKSIFFTAKVSDFIS